MALGTESRAEDTLERFVRAPVSSPGLRTGRKLWAKARIGPEPEPDGGDRAQEPPSVQPEAFWSEAGLRK